MKRSMFYAALLSSAAFPALAQTAAPAPNAPVTPPPSQTYTEEVGKAVPDMKSGDGQVQHGPTKNVGDAVPDMKSGDSSSGAAAGTSATGTAGEAAPAPQPPGTVTIYKDGQPTTTPPSAATGQATGTAGAATTPPAAGANAPVTPKDAETYTKEVGKAVPEMKSDASKEQHPPTKGLSEVVPPMKEGDPASTGSASGTTAPAPK